jgi:hypothetical protein
MNKTILITIIVIIVLVGGVIIFNQHNQAAQKMQETNAMMHPSMKPTDVMKKDTGPSMKDDSMKMQSTGTPGVMKPSGTMMHNENGSDSSMMKDK